MVVHFKTFLFLHSYVSLFMFVTLGWETFSFHIWHPALLYKLWFIQQTWNTSNFTAWLQCKTVSKCFHFILIKAGTLVEWNKLQLVIQLFPSLHCSYSLITLKFTLLNMILHRYWNSKVEQLLQWNILHYIQNLCHPTLQ